MKYLLILFYTVFTIASESTLHPFITEVNKVESERSKLIDSLDRLIRTLENTPQQNNLSESIKILETDAVSTIAKEIADVEIAKVKAMVEISRAIDRIETADTSLHTQVESDAMKRIAQAIASVEIAKAKAMKQIVDTTQKVAQTKNTALPTPKYPKEALTIAKNRSAVQIARSVAHTEVARAVAAIEIARSSASLLPAKADKKELERVKKIQTDATAKISSYLAHIEVVKANMLAKIAKEVARVEVAKAEAGIKEDPTVSTYPKKLIRAD